MKDYTKGTIGNEVYFYRGSDFRRQVIPELDESCFLKPEQLVSERLSLSTLDCFSLSEMRDTDGDEFLRRQGFYDSTDKRCCINQKRR